MTGVQTCALPIWAESTQGVGSCFHVELPFLLQKRPEPALSPVKTMLPEHKPSHSLQILLAEDNLINARSMTAILSRLGHQVTTVADGMQAVEQWRSTRWDCILMDVQMPVLDGIEATRMIRRKNSSGGAIPL